LNHEAALTPPSPTQDAWLVGCWRSHRETDPQLGQPLCADCFDYLGAVLWNACVGELWRRTTISSTSVSCLLCPTARRQAVLPATLPGTPRRAATRAASSTTGCATSASLPISTSTTHLRRFVTAAWWLGGLAHLADLNLRRWAHTLGFRGHWASRSRRYAASHPDHSAVRIGRTHARR